MRDVKQYQDLFDMTWLSAVLAIFPNTLLLPNDLCKMRKDGELMCCFVAQYMIREREREYPPLISFERSSRKSRAILEYPVRINARMEAETSRIDQTNNKCTFRKEGRNKVSFIIFFCRYLHLCTCIYVCIKYKVIFASFWVSKLFRSVNFFDT